MHFSILSISVFQFCLHTSGANFQEFQEFFWPFKSKTKVHCIIRSSSLFDGLNSNQRNFPLSKINRMNTLLFSNTEHQEKPQWWVIFIFLACSIRSVKLQLADPKWHEFSRNLNGWATFLWSDQMSRWDFPMYRRMLRSKIKRIFRISFQFVAILRPVNACMTCVTRLQFSLQFCVEISFDGEEFSTYLAVGISTKSSWFGSVPSSCKLSSI